jgi:predicted anti-sigma-YlaC factor YlaD
MKNAAAAGALLLLSALLLSSCSINKLAVRAVAGMLGGGGDSTVFTGDEDPELVGDALPFALKVYESLLAADPSNAELCLSTGSAFCMYAFAFVQAPADLLPEAEVERQIAMKSRAKKLFMRAREYVLRGIELRHKGFRAELDKGRAAAALAMLKPADIDFLYWAGASWLAAFSVDPFDMTLLVTVPVPQAMLEQVLAWNDGYANGGVHDLFVSFYASVPAEIGGSEQRARMHFARAVELSKGLSLGPYISLAASVSVKNQDAAEFRDMLARALAIDVNADPSGRLQNVISQRKARWLLEHIDDFFLTMEAEQ